MAMRRKTKNLFAVIAVILASVLLVGFIGFISGGFTKNVKDWSVKDQLEGKYTVTYVANDTVFTTQYLQSKVSLPKNTPTYDGTESGTHVFTGWYLANGTTKFTEETELTGDVIVYAHFNKAYRVTFVVDGEEYASSMQALLKFPTAPVKTGYYFDGWFTDASNGVQIREEGGVITEAVTYYAHFTAKSAA